MNKSHSTTNHSAPITHGFELGSRALDAVTETATSFKKAASSGEKMVKQYPVASAGAFLGIGFLVGALIHKLFSHTPTLTETLGIDALPARARRSLKNWL